MYKILLATQHSWLKVKKKETGNGYSLAIIRQTAAGFCLESGVNIVY